MALKRFISVAVPRDFTVEVNATLDRLFGRLFNGGTLSQRDYAEVAAVFASSHGCNTHENRFRETAGCLFLAVNRNFTVLYPPPDRVQNPNDGALDELSLALNHFFEASSLVKAQPSQMIKSLDAKVHLMIAVPLFIDREYRQVNDLLVPVVRRLPGTEAWEFGVIQYLQILSQAKFVLTHISPSDKKR
ncbi:hypothetical protein EBR96_10635, partial [bacterium]|nr:hypothetical protein [bacterium]